MATYEGLRDFLMRQSAREITVSLDEIEELIGAPLPISARKRPQYWANVKKSEHRSPPNKVARSAGYSAFLIRPDQKVRFVKD